VLNSLSEYATMNTEEGDDDSWASEEVSEGVMDAPSTGTQVLAWASVLRQRRRSGYIAYVRLPLKLSASKLFVKQLKSSYSNLGRIQSGLLSQLLNPDPNVFPPGRPYRVVSTHDVTHTTGILGSLHTDSGQVIRRTPPSCPSHCASTHGPCCHIV
jgi:hypothetical protein